MARLDVQEEEKSLILKYSIGLSLYIQQEMEFLTVSTLADAFHYTRKLEAKQKIKECFANKPTGQTSNKKSLVDFDKFKNPSQLTPPKPKHQKNNFQKDKRDHRK